MRIRITGQLPNGRRATLLETDLWHIIHAQMYQGMIVFGMSPDAVRLYVSEGGGQDWREIEQPVYPEEREVMKWQGDES